MDHQWVHKYADISFIFNDHGPRFSSSNNYFASEFHKVDKMYYSVDEFVERVFTVVILADKLYSPFPNRDIAPFRITTMGKVPYVTL